jgi:hypothetical protein
MSFHRPKVFYVLTQPQTIAVGQNQGLTKKLKMGNLLITEVQKYNQIYKKPAVQKLVFKWLLTMK